VEVNTKVIRKTEEVRFRRVFATICPYLYILPGFFFLAFFPQLSKAPSGYGSLFRWLGAAVGGKYVGLENYKYLFSDPDFAKSLLVTVRYVTITSAGSVGLGFLLAVLSGEAVKKRLRGQGFFNSGFFFPYLIPWSATAMIWLWLLHPLHGFVNALLGTDIDWVRSSNTALWAVIIGMVWKVTGYYFILFLAGIQQIPMDYYEAAEIDGIRRHQRLIHITIPLLTPTIFFVGLIAIVSTLEAVDLVYIMTQGGPARATNILIYFIYERAFVYQFWGEAFATSTILLIALLVFVVAYFFLLERKVHYEL